MLLEWRPTRSQRPHQPRFPGLPPSAAACSPPCTDRRFLEALRLVAEARPRAVLLDNVAGLSVGRFAGHRTQILDRLHYLGYCTWWQVIQAADHGVPQLRPRFVLVAIQPPWAGRFAWPAPAPVPVPTVGDTLHQRAFLVMTSRPLV